MITTRTAERLAGMALELQAISDAVYEAGHRKEAQAIEHAAQRAADAAAALDHALTVYAKAALREV